MSARDRSGNGSSVNCAAAKEIDLVSLLDQLGHTPVKIKGVDYWYLSPLRSERTASFKINRKKNRWFDHGTGEGGNTIDFAIRYFNCSVSAALQRLGNASTAAYVPPAKKEMVETVTGIIADKPLQSLSLLRYIAQRGIDQQVAKTYCREITVKLGHQHVTAIGFRNNAGGYELRNLWFKGSTSPKTVTTMESGSAAAYVFEGFFDFLSYQTLMGNKMPAADFLVLNSASFFEKQKQWMERHESVHLFMDNDSTGQRLSTLALSWGKTFRDESGLYSNYKDLNEWLQQTGRSRHKRIGLHGPP